MENLNSLNKVVNLISNAFNVGKASAPDIPPFLLILGANTRNGLSARNLAANTLESLQSKGEIPINDIFADGPNAISSMVLIMAEEMVKHIHENSKVTTIINPGSIQVLSSGTAGPLPVVAQGTNVNIIQAKGIMQ